MAIVHAGDHDYEVKGKPRWDITRWDLDRVTVAYIGSAANFDSFISGLSLGSSYSGNSNMKLMDWDNDDDAQWPTVSLVYAGKKSGSLPPNRAGTGYTIQQAQFTSFLYSDDDGMRITITYLAPTSVKTTWGTSAVDVASIGAATPANCSVVWFTAEAHGSRLTDLPTTASGALSWFVQKTAILGDSEEVVPGVYFRGTQTKQNLLFSSEF